MTETNQLTLNAAGRGLMRRSQTGRWAVAIRWAAAIVFVGFGAAKFANHASELASFRGYSLPAPGIAVYVIGVVEISGGVLLLTGVLVRVAAVVLAGDMIGAIVVSGLGRGEYLSLTLAPALLVAMVFVVGVGGRSRALGRLLDAKRPWRRPPPGR